MRWREAARRRARAHDWAGAAAAWRHYLDRRPADAGAWEQYGHAAKETGALDEAAAAYARAVAITPDAAEPWWHLHDARARLGDRAGAIEACARVAALDPDFAPARERLAALGARDLAPPVASDGTPETVVAPGRYDSWRRGLLVAPPPRHPRRDGAVTVLVDAREALPVAVRATLAALLDQTDQRWRAIVHAAPALRNHPVASLAALDPRVRFDAGDAAWPEPAATLLLTAGTLPDREALAWFAYAAARTGCAAAYADHDHHVDDWRAGRGFTRPVFQPDADPEWFADPAVAPALLYLDRARVPLHGWDAIDVAAIARSAGADGAMAHLPLLLSSRKELAPQAEQAPPDPAPLAPDPGPIAAMVAKDSVEGRIQVVVQTRDAAAMLKAAIDSLRQHAARAELLDVTVVDNRSREPATRRLLDDWVRRGVADVLPLDAPFNWSHANNLAVAAGTAPLLLFLNNDTEMLTPGWDMLLRDALAAPGTGAVGAALFYPDGTLQHAGIVMGMGSGGPIHEGVGRDAAMGPNDRWRRRRAAAAVTGAFLAVRRDLFDAAGGFDATRYAIAFNDIDLCLRLRAAGRRVVVASDVRLLHHESKTRGFNVTRSQVAWDLDELADLHARWGAALFHDPGYNPHWTRDGHPFDGYRYPSRDEILRHIDRAARALPWSPITDADAPYWW
ncbi:glycosyltransferase [Sphingomonas sp. BK069]|uniref:glycosyltransferase n=1 Tax=Sphingomonas sp. BK069 TaxID=2586979 RepID=UPI00161A456E|nr:glycosyltransferase [Sphingomonas sp. BK069]MBB3349618.1 GT2 family glycosyltransferase/tetratricopeptide (TPR) repeat protein [Sphingomonas sp. BK069]